MCVGENKFNKTSNMEIPSYIAPHQVEAIVRINESNPKMAKKVISLIGKYRYLYDHDRRRFLQYVKKCNKVE